VIAEGTRGERLWWNGKVGPEFDKIGTNFICDAGDRPDVAFSPDGRYTAYPVSISARMRMVIGNRRSCDWDRVSGPVFSADGKHLRMRSRTAEE